MRRIKPNIQSRTDRSGAVTVEFAVTVPLLFMLLFAQLEFSRANMIRHAIKTACYEGARAGIVPGATADEVRGAAEEILAAVSVSNFDLTITPSTITSDTTEVTVSISVGVADNSWLPPTYLTDSVLTNSLTLDRERIDLVMF